MFTKSDTDVLNVEIFRSSISRGSFYAVNLVTGFITQSGPTFYERPDQRFGGDERRRN
jgi:hypothetical protein